MTGETIGRDRGEEIVSAGPCPKATCNNITYITRNQYDRFHETGEAFYCIAGHTGAWEAKKEIDAKEKRLKEAERRADEAARRAREAAEAQQAALKARRLAERTCPWPTCEGKALRSPKMLRQHLVDVHGAPWATPEVSADEIGQVLNGRDQTEVVR